MHTSSKHIMFSAPCKKWKREEQRFVSNKNTKRHKGGKKEKNYILEIQKKKHSNNKQKAKGSKQKE